MIDGVECASPIAESNTTITCTTGSRARDYQLEPSFIINFGGTTGHAVNQGNVFRYGLLWSEEYLGDQNYPLVQS